MAKTIKPLSGVPDLPSSLAYEDGTEVRLVPLEKTGGKALNQLSIIGRIVLVNALSMNNPAFNITYHHRGRAITLRYYCNLYDSIN